MSSYKKVDEKYKFCVTAVVYWQAGEREGESVNAALLNVIT